MRDERREEEEGGREKERVDGDERMNGGREGGTGGLTDGGRRSDGHWR